MTIEEQIKILEAARDGEKIEVKLKDPRAEGDPWMPKISGEFNFDGCLYRIVEPKKKRLIRVEELPAVCWVKPTSHPYYCLLAYRSPDGDYIGYSSSRKPISIYDANRDGWQWSSDLKTWNSFEVEE